jgi:hypothetical protein
VRDDAIWLALQRVVAFASMNRDPELQRLLDEAEIRRILARYPRAYDRLDFELLLSMFWPGALDEHGAYQGPIEGYVEWVRANARRDQSYMHHNTSQLIEIEGDQAWTETYCLGIGRHQNDEGQLADRTVRVRYCDRFERRGSEWRIAHRKVVYSESTIESPVVSADFGPHHTRETRDRNDPAYWGRA